MRKAAHREVRGRLGFGVDTLAPMDADRLAELSNQLDQAKTEFEVGQAKIAGMVATTDEHTPAAVAVVINSEMIANLVKAHRELLHTVAELLKEVRADL